MLIDKKHKPINENFLNFKNKSSSEDSDFLRNLSNATPTDSSS